MWHRITPHRRIFRIERERDTIAALANNKYSFLIFIQFILDTLSLHPFTHSYHIICKLMAIPIKYSMAMLFSPLHFYRVMKNVDHSWDLFIILCLLSCLLFMLRSIVLHVINKNANWFRIKPINNCHGCQDGFEYELYSVLIRNKFIKMFFFAFP